MFLNHNKETLESPNYGKNHALRTSDEKSSGIQTLGGDWAIILNILRIFKFSCAESSWKFGIKKLQIFSLSKLIKLKQTVFCSGVGGGLPGPAQPRPRNAFPISNPGPTVRSCEGERRSKTPSLSVSPSLSGWCEASACGGA